MNKFSTILFSLTLYSGASFAAINDEINHLLTFVADTSCQYERNGTLHTGAEAVQHINKKYQYYRDDIKTTEDFIKYAATKSKMSGKHYQIHCADQAVTPSKNWLLAELKRFRQAQNESQNVENSN